MLKDKTIVVTGAARGIGYGVAQAALLAGARVLIADLNQKDLDAARLALCVAAVVAERIGEDPVELLSTMVPAQLERHIQPLEIGRVAVFLLSEQALIIRGQSINADGGDTPY